MPLTEARFEMNELPIFISYRQVDGKNLAYWIDEVIKGRSVTLRGLSTNVTAIVSPYLDRAAPAVGDWESLHGAELDRALALIVLCSPGAMHDYYSRDGLDWFYTELNWWLANRNDAAPILVTSEEHGPRYVPDLIHERWPKAQLVQVDPLAWRIAQPYPPELSLSIDKSIQSILGGIAKSAGDKRIGLEPKPWHPDGLIEAPGLYLWEKDLGFRYTNVNENYARAAGFDSPHAMIGKMDEDMPWRSLVDLFRSGDRQVMSGVENERLVVLEKEIMVDRVADILVTEAPVRDRFGRIVGLSGAFRDVTGSSLSPTCALQMNENGHILLGGQFEDEYFTQLEAMVFKGLVRSIPLAKIAFLLGLTIGGVKALVRSIKRKLCCATEGDIVVTAVRAGLPLELFGPMVNY